MAYSDLGEPERVGEGPRRGPRERETRWRRTRSRRVGVEVRLVLRVGGVGLWLAKGRGASLDSGVEEGLRLSDATDRDDEVRRGEMALEVGADEGLGEGERRRAVDVRKDEGLEAFPREGRVGRPVADVEIEEEDEDESLVARRDGHAPVAMVVASQEDRGARRGKEDSLEALASSRYDLEARRPRVRRVQVHDERVGRPVAMVLEARVRAVAVPRRVALEDHEGPSREATCGELTQ